MKTSDISDAQVVVAYRVAKLDARFLWPYNVIMAGTGCPEKVALSAMKRAHERKLIQYGVSLRSGWLTEAGEALLEQTMQADTPDTSCDKQCQPATSE